MSRFNENEQRGNNQYNAGHAVMVNKVSLSLGERQQLRNRTRMLDRIQYVCIDETLEPLLREVTEIPIQVDKKPEAVLPPMWNVLHEFDKVETLHTDTFSIAQIYDRANGELLILGDAGTGKTILLLQIERELLQRTRMDDTHPIPVICNLTSWARTRQPINEWIIDEISIKYQVPRAALTTWMEENQLLPLLDGLDEVAEKYRADCLEAINAFRQTHGLLPTVVCSRTKEYMALVSRLHLRMAIVLQPLDSQQITSYLAGSVADTEVLLQKLEADPDLYALVRAPLMLNLLQCAYQNISKREAPVATETLSQEQKREQIFAFYVERMLAHRSNTATYPSQQTLHWLSILAQRMKQHNQAIFYLEQLQESWLTSSTLRRTYRFWAVYVPAICIGALLAMATNGFLSTDLFPQFVLMGVLLGSWLGGILSAGNAAQSVSAGSQAKVRGRLHLLRRFVVAMGVGLGCGLSFGLPTGLVLGVSVGLSCFLLQFFLVKSNPSSPQAAARARKALWSLHNPAWRNSLLAFLAFSLSVGLNFVFDTRLTAFMTTKVTAALIALHNNKLLAQMNAVLKAGLNMGISYGLIFAFSIALIAALSSLLLLGKDTAIQPTDEFVWSWRTLAKSLFALPHTRTAILIVVSFEFSFGPAFLSSFGLSFGLSLGLIYGSTMGLVYWLLSGLIQGVMSKSINAEQRLLPNQGIKRSGFNGLMIGLISTIIVWGNIALGTLLREDLKVGPIMTWYKPLITAVSTGLLIGLFNGGLAWLRHYLLRALLIREGAIPRHYISFLDSAAERMLLRRAGGGYGFIHLLMLEYLAKLEDMPQDIETIRYVQEISPQDTHVTE